MRKRFKNVRVSENHTFRSCNLSRENEDHYLKKPAYKFVL